MPRRLISSSRSEIQKMSAQELKQSIKASEGRVILTQNAVVYSPLASGTTNPELAQAFGADMIFFNTYSMESSEKHNDLVVEEYIDGEGFIEKDYRLNEMKKLIDVPLGIYLECGAGDDSHTSTAPNSKLVREDRVANKRNLEKAKEEGADFIVLGGNPGTSTSFDRIIESTKKAKDVLGNEVLIFAGKWEDGVKEKVLGDPTAKVDHKEIIKKLIDAGADVICLPMPGSRTAITVEAIRELVTFVHTYEKDTLVMSFLDASVEGSDIDTVRQCTLWSKQTGADIHAIGDAGLSGMSVPENIYQMSITTKGRRLTFRRLAGSRR